MRKGLELMKLFIKNGHVIDPANGIDGVTDIYIENGVVAEVGINEDEAVANLLKDALFEKITVTKDFNGVNRVVTAIK